MKQLDIFKPPTGKELRDDGIRRALQRADDTHGEWKERAYDFLLEYLKGLEGEFMAEEVRVASLETIPAPPSNRAWGGIILKAARAGLIRQVGFRSVKNPRAHCAIVGVWCKA